MHGVPLRREHWTHVGPAFFCRAISAFTVSLFGLLLCVSAYAAGPSASDRVPVQAELVQALDAGRLKVGDSVFAKVDVGWENPECKLRKGAILKGRVVARNAHSKASRTSEIALLFESGQCGAGQAMKEFPLTIAALMAPNPHRDDNLFAGEQSQPLSDAVGLSVGGEGGRSAGLGVGGGGGSLRSVTAAAATVFVEPARYTPPKAVMPGDVVGIRGVKLGVGSGPQGSSVLSASKHNVRLDSGSQLVLMPSPKPPALPVPKNRAGVSGAATPSAPSVAAAQPPPDLSTLADVTELCSPPQCSVATPVTDADQPAAGAAATLSVRDLGYPPRNDFELAGFDFDSALSYLGPSQLLFTFDPHVLVPRTGVDSSFRQLRLIRGVVLDLKTMKVEKTLEWRVPDGGQYLWSLGSSQILLHMGRELRLYGSGLKLEQELKLDGPLAFVRTSPSGGYVAVGTVRERYTEAMRRQLEEAESREPEEDVQIKVLDSAFHTLATVVRSSREVPPVLSDEGEVRVLSRGRNRWRIVEFSWIGQRRILAQVNSTCLPEVTSVPGDLLFAIGCDREADGKWYRMLRPDGKPVLKGWSPSDEMEQTANAGSRSEAFAVGVAELTKPLMPDSVFRRTDLKREHIAIYRRENGRRILAVSIPSPAPTVQTFALSPTGNQLAVLRGDQIALYSVPIAEASK